MSRLTLDDVVERNGLADQAQALGHFDPARVPALQIAPFESVRRVRVAVSPDCSFRLVRDALAAAQQTLDLYIYNVSADHLVDLLRDAKGRGVRVRIMYDVTDTRGDERQKLRGLDVELKEAPSSGRRQVFTVCHQKFAVIDQGIVLLGSANWAGTSIPEVTVPGKFKKGNREWLIRIDDLAVARWFAGLFQTDWDIPALPAPPGALAEPLAPALAGRDVPAAAVTVPDEVFDIEAPDLGPGARVTPILSPDNYFRLTRDLIRSAQSSIDVEQQYILAGGPRTRGLLEDLADRAAHVRVRILVSPAFAENWKKSVETLEAAGLLDRLRAINLDSFTHLHNKGVLVDGKAVIVSSTNWSENSITRAREAGVLVESAAVAGYYGRVVDVDWASGIAPDDVPQHLAAMEDALARVDTPTEEIHPADRRVV
jgi:phosphatidylserine/phosphatidylglycerophosphate/cardiolipin synthase-like enzyme